MTTSAMIAVMQAFDRGEQIECRSRVEGSEWIDQKDNITWNWHMFEYRVKSKPAYRPYMDAAEFLAAQKEHGLYLQVKSCKEVAMPLLVNDYGVLLPSYTPRCFDGKQVSYDTLFTIYTWQDGTPCGKMDKVLK